jgi:hypothetical protein
MPDNYYPLMVEWWVILLLVIALLAYGGLAYRKHGQPDSFGLVALPIVALTAFGWFGGIPLFWVGVVIITVFVMVMIGLIVPDSKDDKWHYGALFVALFGKLIPWVFVWLISVVTVEHSVKMPVQLLIFLLVVAVIIGAFLVVSTSAGRGKVRKEKNLV